MTQFFPQPMRFVDSSSVPPPVAQSFHAFGYAAAAFRLSPQLQWMHIAVQAVVLPVDPGTCPVVSNALTFVVQ